MSSRILDQGEETWEEWIIEQCGLDYYEYTMHPEILTMRVLESNLFKIINLIENLEESLPFQGSDRANIAYQILTLMVLETGSFLPEKVKQEVFKSTIWGYDRRWGWRDSLIEKRKFFLRQFRRNLRQYNGEKVFLEKIPNKSKLFDKFYSVDKFYNYLNSKYNFRKLLKAFSVKFIYFDMCNLELIPPEVFLCKNLRELSLSNNFLSDIPREISNFPHLKKLILSHNRITSLPEEIDNLRSLELLWVDDNRLSSLPSSLDCLKELKDFDFSKNNI